MCMVTGKIYIKWYMHSQEWEVKKQSLPRDYGSWTASNSGRSSPDVVGLRRRTSLVFPWHMGFWDLVDNVCRWLMDFDQSSAD